tara:strand:+ start:2271 stop:2885 length:615 start_codon:yes stop_codon:yes gene_type:complete
MKGLPVAQSESLSSNPAPVEPIKPDHAVVVSDAVPLITRSGFEFHVRPVQPSDKDALAEFFTHVSKEDLRFRFLSAVQEVPGPLLEMLVNVDHETKEDYIAFDIDDKTIIASAMVGAKNDKSEAEVAIVVRSDYKHRGLSWTFLKYVIEEARRRGIKKLQSLESRDNYAAIELEKEMGFSARTCPGDSTLMLLEFDLTVNQPTS